MKGGFVKNLMYNIVCSDINLLELKLERIRICKRNLLDSKPFRLNLTKFRDWSLNFSKIELEEEAVLEELQKAYKDLEDFL